MAARSCLGEQFRSVICSAQQGAPWALACLYEHLQPPVLAFLRSQDREAEDIAADAWVDVARGLGAFEGDEAAFRRWVFTIVRRRLIDTRRARARRRTEPVPPERLDTPATDAALEAIEGDAALRRIVKLLPDAQAHVVLLRVVGGFTVEEVAAIVGRRPGAVRALQHRALRQLAKKVPHPRNAGVSPSDVYG